MARSLGSVSPCSAVNPDPSVPRTAAIGGNSDCPADIASTWRFALAWLVGAAVLRAALSALVPLLPDETYYWTWTRRLEAGYFDHPPGIALLIAFGVRLAGDTVSGVRAGPAVAAFVTSVSGTVAACLLAGRGRDGATAALRAAVLYATIPLITLGSVLATPDAALFATAVPALLGVERALASPVRSWRAFGWWTAAGLALGAAFVSKYTAVLLPAGLVVACLVHPALRSRFREAGPWWASLLALVVFSPVVVWNYFNEWISFRFQLGHGFSAAAKGSVLTRELELLGGQIGLASPVLFCLMALAIWTALRDGWNARRTLQPVDLATRRFAIAVIAVIPMCFFAVSASRRSVEANWPALIYPAAILLLSTETRSYALGRWWRGGIALAAVLIGVVAVQAWRPVLPLPPRRDPMARAHGWTTLSEAVENARRDSFLEGTVDRWIAANRYQDASELTFHLSDHPVVFSLNIDARPNQYDLWETAFDKVHPGDGMVAVFDDDAVGDSVGVRVARWFKESRRGNAVVLKRGDGTVAQRRVWLYRIATDVPPRPRGLPSLSAGR